ncbi:LysM peptidoglycan-binding domain-containing protein [Actinomyces lilanjuaniae]|uniref:LysM peptidoglycan-binding domain-containing protein n=1 Tax=Actinomyces lilanjuaniae TaxID=2321394 RepID=A0ABM6Z2H3_9ACTO|nr:LysM domain-containing protein [Actinomyces lilanjuaniae]AYD89365.1 LysM peptidoglycan-binding domain-containing protein [Actinomyces lilanjuaniae]
MTQRTGLTVLAVASAALTAALCVALLSSVRTLEETPLSLWGGSQLTSAVVALASGAGAAGALWHAVSAAAALAALPGAGGRGHPASDVASRLLQRWGAPLVRRVAVGAVVAGLSTAPALAAEPDPPPNDLGWRPASSATQETPASTTPEPTDPRPQEVGSTPQEPAEPPGSPPRSHTVTPGESLWSVTVHSLPAGSSAEDISAAWPALYEANREVIGPDPAVLRPGTTLTLPEWTATTQVPQEGQDTRPSPP